MKVEIWLEKSSQGIVHPTVEMTYQKGDLFCIKSIRDKDPVVFKYPISTIFCIKESDFVKSH